MICDETKKTSIKDHHLLFVCQSMKNISLWLTIQNVCVQIICVGFASLITLGLSCKYVVRIQKKFTKYNWFQRKMKK